MKKIVIITLEVRELLHDVMNRAHLTGAARRAAGLNDVAVSKMQASNDEEADYQIMRSVGKAFAEVKHEMGEYLQEDGTTSDNRINGAIELGDKLLLGLRLPSNHDNSGCDGLGALLHEYIVLRTLGEWYIITNRDEATGYAELAAIALERAKKMLYKRLRPTRRTQNK